MGVPAVHVGVNFAERTFTWAVWSEELKKLFPELSDEQHQQAEERLAKYLAIAAEVFEGLSKDPARYTEFRRRRDEYDRDKRHEPPTAQQPALW